MTTVSFLGLERDAVPPAFCGAGVLQRRLHSLPRVYMLPADQQALLVDVARWRDPAEAAIAMLGRDARHELPLRSLLGGYAAAIYDQVMRAVSGCPDARDWCEEWFFGWPALQVRAVDGPNPVDMRSVGMVVADHVRDLEAAWAGTIRQTERRVAAERLAAVYPSAEPTDSGAAKVGFDHPDFGRIVVYATAPKFGPVGRGEAVRAVRNALRIVLLAHHVSKAHGVSRYGSPDIVRDVVLDPRIPSEARFFLKAMRAGEHHDVPLECRPFMETVDRQAYAMADGACRFRD